jgi:hypothetical protein
MEVNDWVASHPKTDYSLSPKAKQESRPFLWEDWDSLLNEGLIEFNRQLEALGHQLDPDYAVTQIQNGYLGYVLAGLTLKKVFRFRLWSKWYKSVSEFCQKILGKPVWYCKKTIQAAEVVLDLAAAGFKKLPLCQSQAEELLNSQDFPEGPVDAWAEVLKQHEATGESITARFIRSVVAPHLIEKENKSLRISPEIYRLAKERAKLAGMTPKDWIEDLIKGATKVPDFDADELDQKVEDWQKDLDDLVEEHQPQTEPQTQPEPSSPTQPTQSNKIEQGYIPKTQKLSATPPKSKKPKSRNTLARILGWGDGTLSPSPG